MFLLTANKDTENSVKVDSEYFIPIIEKNVVDKFLYLYNIICLSVYELLGCLQVHFPSARLQITLLFF